MSRLLRRVAVTAAGALLVVTGAALLVLPGPGLLVIAAGLGLLATEYAWARRLLGTVVDRARWVAVETARSPWRVAAAVATALALAGLGVAALAVPGLPAGGPATGGSLLFAAAVMVGSLWASMRVAQREEQAEGDEGDRERAADRGPVAAGVDDDPRER